jgi:hypothetical protein
MVDHEAWTQIVASVHRLTRTQPIMSIWIMRRAAGRCNSTARLQTCGLPLQVAVLRRVNQERADPPGYVDRGGMGGALG